MKIIKIRTLTPVHIGSGEYLKNNLDFVQYKDGEDSYLSILDLNKILSFIGVERIDDWVNLIAQKGDMVEYMAKLGRNIKPRAYAVRILKNHAQSLNNEESLKECIHDGLGRAYIPGSSIKGAMRTAVLSILAERMYKLENLVVKQKNDKKIVSAKLVESKLFGQDPNSDIFRFVKVGDAYFSDGCELSIRAVNLNTRKIKDLKDFSKQQLVEVIGAGMETEFRMKLDKSYYDWAKRKCDYNGEKIRSLGNLPKEIEDISSLFELINNHTSKLIKNELDYWSDFKKHGYLGAEEYLQNMEYIWKEVKHCNNGKECVLRIGHASGWGFITGAWAKKLENFKSDIVPVARPKNHKYQQYDFPKSRRLDENGNIFGFVKLSIYG